GVVNEPAWSFKRCFFASSLICASAGAGPGGLQGEGRRFHWLDFIGRGYAVFSRSRAASTGAHDQKALNRSGLVAAQAAAAAERVRSIEPSADNHVLIRWHRDFPTQIGEGADGPLGLEEKSRLILCRFGLECPGAMLNLWGEA